MPEAELKCVWLTVGYSYFLFLLDQIVYGLDFVVFTRVQWVGGLSVKKDFSKTTLRYSIFTKNVHFITDLEGLVHYIILWQSLPGLSCFLRPFFPPKIFGGTIDMLTAVMPVPTRWHACFT